jgi:thiamine biosynthesis lipoprotein
MLMGTVVEVTAIAPNEATAGRAAAAALAEIRRLEEALSTWIETSELSQVNDAAGRRAVQVSPDTLALISRAIQIADLTDGAFNIAIGPAVETWRRYEDAGLPAQSELDGLKATMKLSDIRIDDGAQTVFLTTPGMRIDVGGIGKGFAADRAIEAMRRAGATAGVVALSGDIKTFGINADGRPFLFGIRHPREPDRLLARIELRDAAVSTAGDYERYFDRDGVRYHHILDPQTLQPARKCWSVTVVAKEGVMADGLDTGVFVMGPERGMALIERLPDVDGVIVDSSGKVWVSSGLKDRLILEGPAAKMAP